jgi:glycerol-3-phosphate dehydrogenase (NAD(P)+)
VIGVEVGGAVKNVLAIAAGMSDGLHFGANARIALISRGLAEMTRLGVALGARAATFMGLSGMGDLVLTCTDDQSRNRRVGLLIAAGKSVREAEREIGSVCEGIYGARAVWEVAQAHGVDMPICEQVHRILYEDVAPEEAVTALMSRALKPEALD